MNVKQATDFFSTALVIATEGIQILPHLVDVDAFTLQGCAAEDPTSLNDLAIVWPRYRFHAANTEFVDGLAFLETSFQDGIESLMESDTWFALDLIQKRLFTGGCFPRLRIHGEHVSSDDRSSPTIVLPPHWELHQHVNAHEIEFVRTSPADLPRARRDVLWGPCMTQFFAERMMQAVLNGRNWIGKDWDGCPCGSYELTKEIHRDWLMTPCAELSGDIPRNQLHIARRWIRDLVEGQIQGVYRGEERTPVSAELSTYDHAPIGDHEMIMYFDACRETIDAGWRWLLADERRTRIGMPVDTTNVRQLRQVMDAALKDWLNQPSEGGSSPAVVIQFERTRIPLLSSDENHVLDCDCPLCEMMAEGSFGPSIACFGGHHLELDDEFAFSMCKTIEEWQMEQGEWAEVNASVQADRRQQQLSNSDLSVDGSGSSVEVDNDSEFESGSKFESGSRFDGGADTDFDDGDLDVASDDAFDGASDNAFDGAFAVDEFTSSWNHKIAHDMCFPEGRHGHLSLAFRVADIVSFLKQSPDSQRDVDDLNDAFRKYRHAVPGEIHVTANRFKQVLESLTNNHVDLVGRCADLQSLIDEYSRAAMLDDYDIPF